LYVVKSLCMCVTKEFSEFNFLGLIIVVIYISSLPQAAPENLTEVESAVILRQQSYSPTPTERR
jgi:hypothetical protein